MKAKIMTRVSVVLGILLVGSVYFNWSLDRTIQNSKTSAERNLIQGVLEIHVANTSMNRGKLQTAYAEANNAAGYLNASSADIGQFGVRHVTGLSMFFTKAFADLTGVNPKANKSEKDHDEKVISALFNNFKPLLKVEPGSISDTQLNKAIDNVYQAMTPQERSQYQGWES